MRPSMTLLSSVLVATAGLAAAPDATAATSRILYTTASNACQPATPLELGGLRFRPLGIYNNKSTAIYISCSLDTEFVGDVDTTDVSVVFDNQGVADQQIDCTFQGGSRNSGVNNYPVSQPITAGAAVEVSQANVDKGTTSYTTLNISCLLPPKVEMGLIRWNQTDVGDGL